MFANKMFVVCSMWLLCCIFSLSIDYDINMSKNEYFNVGLTLLATTVSGGEGSMLRLW